MSDFLKTYSSGDQLEAAQWNRVVELLRREAGEAHSFADCTGIYTASSNADVSSSEIVQFKLAADFTTGGSANAKRLEWDATSEAYSEKDETISVCDPRKCWPNAKSGTGGEARVRQGKEGRTIYEIIDLFCNL